MKIQPDRQKGAALVLVLGIVALVSAWAVSVARDDWLALQRQGNWQLSAQAALLAESGLERGRAIIASDGHDKEVDSLHERWAQEYTEDVSDNAGFSMEITDANRFFNLNDLVDKTGKARPHVVAVAKRLFARADMPPDLVDAVVDWMDADHEPYGSHGQEHTNADALFRIKNAPMDRIEELLLLPGFDAGMVDRLRWLVIVRPAGNSVTPVNINTASAELLQTLGEEIDERDVAELIDHRQNVPFGQVAEMTARMPSFRSVGAEWLTVASNAFIIRATGRTGRVYWREEMMVERRQQGLQTVYRQRVAL